MLPPWPVLPAALLFALDDAWLGSDELLGKEGLAAAAAAAVLPFDCCDDGAIDLGFSLPGVGGACCRVGALVWPSGLDAGVVAATTTGSDIVFLLAGGLAAACRCLLLLVVLVVRAELFALGLEVVFTAA